MEKISYVLPVMTYFIVNNDTRNVTSNILWTIDLIRII